MIQLTVTREPWCGYYVTDENYEPGYPLGTGRTIQAALEDYLEQAWDFYVCGPKGDESMIADEGRGLIKYQWK